MANESNVPKFGIDILISNGENYDMFSAYS